MTDSRLLQNSAFSFVYTKPLRIPVLCRLWQEDDVWNASAEHLPVAVFGDSLKEAEDNLYNAIFSHLSCLKQEDLEKLAKARNHSDSDDNPNVKFKIKYIMTFEV